MTLGIWNENGYTRMGPQTLMSIGGSLGRNHGALFGRGRVSKPAAAYYRYSSVLNFRRWINNVLPVLPVFSRVGSRCILWIMTWGFNKICITKVLYGLQQSVQRSHFGPIKGPRAIITPFCVVPTYTFSPSASMWVTLTRGRPQAKRSPSQKMAKPWPPQAAGDIWKHINCFMCFSSMKITVHKVVYSFICQLIAE